MSEDTGEDELLSVSVGEPFLSDYNIHELPGDHEDSEDSDEILVSVAQMACIEALEAENKLLQKQMESAKPKFTIHK